MKNPEFITHGNVSAEAVENIKKELFKIKEVMDMKNFTTGLSNIDKYLKTYIPRLKEELDHIYKD